MMEFGRGVLLVGSDLSSERERLYTDIDFIWRSKSCYALWLPAAGVKFRTERNVGKWEATVSSTAYLWQLCRSVKKHVKMRAGKEMLINGVVEGTLVIVLTAYAYTRWFLAEFISTKGKERKALEHSVVSDNRTQVLINTFIRFGRSFTADVNSDYWKRLERNEIILRYYYGMLFRILEKAWKKSPILITDYAAYTHQWTAHIAWRKHRGRSYTLGCGEQLVKKQPLRGPILHTKCHYMYRKDFRGIEHREQAEASLVKRVQSRASITTAYMQERKKTWIDLSTPIKLAIRRSGEFSILFLHDFYDSPHIYRWLVFKSLYDHARETINAFKAQKRVLLVKPHPNCLEETKAVYESLRKETECDFIKWISPQISNQTLFRYKPTMSISGYGSVMVESVYAGVPAIAAGDHPGFEVGLGLTARYKEEYLRLLRIKEFGEFGEKEDAIVFMQQHYSQVYEDRCSWLTYNSCKSASERHDIITKAFEEADLHEGPDWT